MTRLSPALTVTMLPQGAALIEETGFKADMKMRSMSSEIVRAARLSWQPVKAGGSYAPEEVDRASVAGSGQAGLSNLETRHTFVLSDLFNPKNT